MGIKKKRGSLYLLLVPRSEALALPIEVERATQKPTPKYAYRITAPATMSVLHIPHRASTVASSLTSNENLRDSRTSRTKRKQRLSLCHIAPCHKHPPPFGSGLLPKNNGKYTHYFTITPKIIDFFYFYTPSNKFLLCIFGFTKIGCISTMHRLIWNCFLLALSLWLWMALWRIFWSFLGLYG